MNRFASRFALLALTTSSITALVVACSANGNGDGILTEDGSEAGATEPDPNGLLPPSNADSGSSSDAKSDAKKDAATDAKKESGVDAGVPAPNEGDPCAVVDQIFTRQCGACGTQESLCLADASGSGGTVSAYSQCVDELAGGCLPGATENESCGNCGTRVRTCNKYCGWTAGTCTGEPPNACSPTANDWTSAGCGIAGTVRTRQCGATCAWSSFSSCVALDFELTVAGTATGEVSAIYPLRASIAGTRIGGTCGSNYFSTTTNHPYVYVELKNPTASTLTMSAWNAAAPNAGQNIATAMTVYAGTTKPADDTARKACVKTVSTYCSTTAVPCGWSSFAALTGTNAFSIPPNGAVLLFFQSYYAAGGSSASEGDVKLVVRTDAVTPP